MAIDDNTSYELTGYQVKDLAQKIRGKADDDVFVGAGTSVAGSRGLVPAPAAGDNTKFLKGDGTWQALTNIFYPVGSIYMTASLATAADVEAALGGTWVSWGAGRVPVGVDTSDTDFDTAEETGGEKTHQLTVAEMPTHTHPIYATSSESDGNQQDGLRSTGRWYGNSHGSPNVANAGGDGAHNNLQPYITCYMYKRTA